MTASAQITAEDLKAAIAARYEMPEWHVEQEVTLASRRIDVVALNLWGARGYRIVGFEIKISRGDWLRELSDFTKQEEWLAVVDSFYVVTPPKLVKPDELPPGWGLLELTGSRMMTKVMASTRPPRPTIPREVAARFLGRIVTSYDNRKREEESKIRMEIHDQLTKSVTSRIESSYKAELEGAKESLREYQELLRVLGVSRGEWKAREKALRAAGAYAEACGDVDRIKDQMRMVISGFERHSATMRKALGEIGVL